MGLHLVTGYAGSAHITSADTGAFNASVYGAGEYVLESGNEFSASVISNNQIRILDGDILMQGRHINLKANTYADIEIANGLQGMNRNDLIVVRYTKDATTGIENTDFAVIQGVSTDGTATDPEYTTGDILSGDCLLNDMPLYRVVLSGLNVSEVVPLFKTVTTVEILKNASDAIEALLGDTDISAIGDGTVTGGLSNVRNALNVLRAYYQIYNLHALITAENGLSVRNSDSSAFANVKALDFLINGSQSVAESFHTCELPTTTFTDVDAITEYLDSGCLPSNPYTWYRGCVNANVSYPTFGTGGSFYLEGFTGRSIGQWQRMTIYSAVGALKVWERSMFNSTWTAWENVTEKSLPFTGGTMTGTLKSQDVMPSVADKHSCGGAILPWAYVRSNYFQMVKDGAETACLKSSAWGTESVNGRIILEVGNGRAAGTEGNALGTLRLYGDGKAYTQLYPTNHSDTSITICLPSSAGTLMLKENIYTDDEGYVVFDLD